MDQQITRHDIPETVKNVIGVAIEKDVIDIFDFYGIAVEYKDDWKALVSHLCEIAFCSIHWDSSKHIAVVEAAEEYWKEIHSE